MSDKKHDTPPVSGKKDDVPAKKKPVDTDKVKNEEGNVGIPRGADRFK